VTVALHLINDTAAPVSFQSVDVALSIDPAVFTILSSPPAQAPRVGSLTLGFDSLFSISNGQINGTESSPTAVTLAARPGGAGTFSSGTVLLFDVSVSPQAAVGNYALNLLAQGSAVTTAINEGEVPLVPPPTNQANDGLIDGLIRVVPEPTALGLMGFGLGLLGLARLWFSGRFRAWAGGGPAG
jgi:hypothetical protein